VKATSGTINAYGVHHVFCTTCGVRPYGWGEQPSGGKFYAVQLACLDDVDDKEFVEAPVTYHDGRNDQYDAAPSLWNHL
jgi:hypothetical protein